MAQVLNDRIIKLLFFVVLMLHVISDGQTYTIISGMLNIVTLSQSVILRAYDFHHIKDFSDRYASMIFLESINLTKPNIF